ncbi:MAG: dihydropteroate synthase [Candidatus Thermoplasmatota archaeon]|nr:dihydropteroate synthase [Candidatus Thermoplasmatota archaeon]
MRNPHIRFIHDTEEAAKIIRALGSEEAGVQIMKRKAVFRAVQVYDAPSRSALIIKQEALACGAEAAISKEALNGKNTDILITGTEAQMYRLAEKLAHQYKSLKDLGGKIIQLLENAERTSLPIKIRKTVFDWKRTYVMGVLNVTPDSFSDGGKFFDASAALKRALEMVKEGADIIDIGGESTRPGSEPVSADEESKRVIPVIKAIRKKSEIPISIDTYKPEVAKAAIEAGADIINDVYGLRKKGTIETAAKLGVPVIIMHMLGKPKDMQSKPGYKDVVAESIEFLQERIEKAKAAGIKEIIVDPGLGFGKRTGSGIEDNCEILRRLSEYKTLGCPILVGASRKRFIGNILGGAPEGERLEGSIAAHALAAANGANIIRTHDVKETVKALKIADAVKSANR